VYFTQRKQLQVLHKRKKSQLHNYLISTKFSIAKKQFKNWRKYRKNASLRNQLRQLSDSMSTLDRETKISEAHVFSQQVLENKSEYAYLLMERWNSKLRMLEPIYLDLMIYWSSLLKANVNLTSLSQLLSKCSHSSLLPEFSDQRG